MLRARVPRVGPPSTFGSSLAALELLVVTTVPYTLVMIETPRRKRTMHGGFLASGKVASACAVAVSAQGWNLPSKTRCSHVLQLGIQRCCVQWRGVHVHISLTIFNYTTVLEGNYSHSTYPLIQRLSSCSRPSQPSKLTETTSVPRRHVTGQSFAKSLCFAAHAGQARMLYTSRNVNAACLLRHDLRNLRQAI